MSSGRNRDDCPECGYRKPGHKVRCRFGSALADGRAQAERELMGPQMRALRGVVAEQVYQPVVPTGQGFADMVDRITRAVAEHVGAVPVPVCGRYVDHEPHLWTEDAVTVLCSGKGTRARTLAEAMEQGIGLVAQNTPAGRCPECGEPYRTTLPGTPDEGWSCTHASGCTWVWTRGPLDQPVPDSAPTQGPSGTVDGIHPHRPVTPERAAAMLAGRQSPTSCIRCGQPGIDATVRHLPDCPELDREAEHWSAAPEMEAAAREGWESHGPQGAAVASGCPGCGAVPTRTRQGRSILHAATCPRVLDARTPSDPSGKRYGECPQTERHTAHQWTGGVGDEVRYWCDGEPSADGS